MKLKNLFFRPSTYTVFNNHTYTMTHTYKQNTQVHITYIPHIAWRQPQWVRWWNHTSKLQTSSRILTFKSRIIHFNFVSSTRIWLWRCISERVDCLYMIVSRTAHLRQHTYKFTLYCRSDFAKLIAFYSRYDHSVTCLFIFSTLSLHQYFLKLLL